MAERFSFEEYERRMKGVPDEKSSYDYPAQREPEPQRDDYTYSISHYMDDHSLGWTDTSEESGGFLGWLLRVGLALAFVVAPIAYFIGAILWGILH